MALETANYMQRTGSIVRYGSPYGTPDRGFPPELQARARKLYEPQPTPSPAPEPKPVPAPEPAPKPKPRTDDDKRRQKRELYYVTYTKVNLVTGELYAGRARGLVAVSARPHPDEYLPIITFREGAEGKNIIMGDRFGPAVIENVARATRPLWDRWNHPAYQAIRGREQQLIYLQGGAWSDVGRANTNSGNSIPGVRADHDLRFKFHDRSNEYFGRLAEFTGKPSMKLAR